MSSKELGIHEVIYELYNTNNNFKLLLELLKKEYVENSVFNPDLARMSYLLGQKELVEALLVMSTIIPKEDEVSDDDEWN